MKYEKKVMCQKKCPAGRKNTRCNRNRGHPCLRANSRHFEIIGVNSVEHVEKWCAEPWRRLRNDCVQLHVRAYGDCPVSWRRHTCGCYTAQGASQHRLRGVCGSWRRWVESLVHAMRARTRTRANVNVRPRPLGENEQAQNSKKKLKRQEFKNKHQHHITHRTQHNISQQHTSLKRRPTKKHFALCPIIPSFHGGGRLQGQKHQGASCRRPHCEVHGASETHSGPAQADRAWNSQNARR